MAETLGGTKRKAVERGRAAAEVGANSGKAVVRPRGRRIERLDRWRQSEIEEAWMVRVGDRGWKIGVALAEQAVTKNSDVARFQHETRAKLTAHRHEAREGPRIWQGRRITFELAGKRV